MWLQAISEGKGRGIDITPGALDAVCLGPAAAAAAAQMDAT
jgi:hypothetical protein